MKLKLGILCSALCNGPKNTKKWAANQVQTKQVVVVVEAKTKQVNSELEKSLSYPM